MSPGQPRPANPVSKVSSHLGNRPYVTLQPKNLVTALRNLLSELDVAAFSFQDEQAFAELKRILNQRIGDLESFAPAAPVPDSVKTPGTADETSTGISIE